MASIPVAVETCNIPEAPCSINGFFDIGAQRVQITGRGTSPGEAVANLMGTLEAYTQASATPQAAEKRSAEDWLGEWMDGAISRGDTCVNRLLAGYALYKRGHVTPVAISEYDLLPSNERHYLVRSADSERQYAVTLPSWECTCPDHTRHASESQRYTCKHITAALFHKKCA